jgi:DNA-binding transcriptional LysR family regulator
MTLPVLDLDCVRAFLATADLRSFTRAAASLNRTQSAVSMQMKRLEEQLGVSLLRRSKSGVDLTLAGERFLGDARAWSRSTTTLSVGSSSTIWRVTFGSARWKTMAPL